VEKKEAVPPSAPGKAGLDLYFFFLLPLLPPFFLAALLRLLLAFFAGAAGGAASAGAGFSAAGSEAMTASLKRKHIVFSVQSKFWGIR